jgi:hypothetical protein
MDYHPQEELQQLYTNKKGQTKNIRLPTVVI